MSQMPTPPPNSPQVPQWVFVAARQITPCTVKGVLRSQEDYDEDVQQNAEDIFEAFQKHAPVPTPASAEVREAEIAIRRALTETPHINPTVGPQGWIENIDWTDWMVKRNKAIELLAALARTAAQGVTEARLVEALQLANWIAGFVTPMGLGDDEYEKFKQARQKVYELEAQVLAK